MIGTTNKKSRIYGTSDWSDLSIYLSALLKLESTPENPLPRICSRIRSLSHSLRERILGSRCKSDWLRQITWQMGVDAGADSRERMRERILSGADSFWLAVTDLPIQSDSGVDAGADARADVGADTKSCDLSEPIRFASAPERISSLEISNFWQQ